MKQILILYFWYFEPMSLATAERWKLRQLRPLFLILARSARRQYRTHYCTQYTVQCAYADSSALANSITEGSVLLDPTTPNWFPAVPHRPRLARRKNILNWLANGGAGCFSIRGIYTPSVWTKLQTNCTCRSGVWSNSCLLQFNSISSSDTWFRRFVEILVERHVNCYKSLGTAFWIFKFNFNLPFLMWSRYNTIIIPLQYPIIYML